MLAVSNMSLLFTVRHGKSHSSWSGSILSLKILSLYLNGTPTQTKNLCFLATSVLRFALLPYYHKIQEEILWPGVRNRSDIFFIYIDMKKKSFTLRNWLSSCHPHNMFISYVGYSKNSQNYTNCTRNWSLVVS